MAKKPLPSPEVLRQLLRYEPETGKLFWKERGAEWFSAEWQRRQWNKRLAGTEAFRTVYGPRGYLQGSIFNEMYMSHRIVYCMHFGDPGVLEIDHLDGNRTNNRIENLRAVSGMENAKNRGLGKNNTAGVLGLYYNKADRFWYARIRVARVDHYLGRFSDLEAATEARREAERRHGFHENHGGRDAYRPAHEVI